MKVEGKLVDKGKGIERRKRGILKRMMGESM
jgi:hypothetical protein